MSEKMFGYLEVHAVDHCNNNCRWCNNHSPFAPEVEYQAEQYIPWMDILEKKGICFDMISVMGGEPFLHSDLVRFVYELRHRFPQKTMAISSNGFWLGKETVDSYETLWKMTDILFVSLYPNLLRGVGGDHVVRSFLERIKKYNPRISIDARSKQDFREIEYYDLPVEPGVFCGTSECTTLLADGRLARCGLGGYAHYNRHVGTAFRNSSQMFFDLKADFSTGLFWNWRRRWPFDACYHCSSYQWKMSAWKVEKGTKRNLATEIDHDMRAGERLMALRKWEAAEALLRTVADKDPSRGNVLNLLAVCVSRRSPAAAVAYLEKALAINPEDLAALENLAEVKRMLRLSPARSR